MFTRYLKSFDKYENFGINLYVVIWDELKMSYILKKNLL